MRKILGGLVVAAVLSWRALFVGYGLLALISGANNGLGTVVDLGTARALPKYIPELSRSGGPRAPDGRLEDVVERGSGPALGVRVGSVGAGSPAVKRRL